MSNQPEPFTTPSPGSIEAFSAGCKCPRVDNRWGRGLYTDENGVAQFVINLECPLHGWEEKRVEAEAVRG